MGSWFTCVVATLSIAASASPVTATDLDCFCEAWADQCGASPTAECTGTCTSVGDYQMGFQVYQSAPGCDLLEANYAVTNDNTDVTVMVHAYGTRPGENIYFQNDCSLCFGGECCARCECGPACGGDIDNCTVMTSCLVCGCELDEDVFPVSPNGDIVGDTCNEPKQFPPYEDPERDCDNSGDICNTEGPEWCAYLTPPLDPPVGPAGAHFEITALSWDGGACYYILEKQEVILIAQDAIVLVTNSNCPATQGGSVPRICH